MVTADAVPTDAALADTAPADAVPVDPPSLLNQNNHYLMRFNDVHILNDLQTKHLWTFERY